MYRVDGTVATPLQAKSMTELGLTEPLHLEAWLVAHPEALGADLMIVTTQFNSWESETGSAAERPDILALSSSGELVVIELKRGGDRKVHLQAITYGALAATFTLQKLAAAHAAWRHQNGAQISQEDAVELLRSHVEGGWDEKVLELPKLVIVAETFPAQVLTTIHWLAQVAPNLSFECFDYSLFEGGDGEGHFVVFNRIFPISDFSDQILVAAERETQGARELISRNKRRARSAQIIHDKQLIPDGAVVQLQLETLVRPEVIALVQNWLEVDPLRQQFIWRDDPVRPLTWGAADDPDTRWTPSALRNEIFSQAGVEKWSFSAADAWSYMGRNLYLIANEVDADSH